MVLLPAVTAAALLLTAPSAPPSQAGGAPAAVGADAAQEALTPAAQPGAVTSLGPTAAPATAQPGPGDAPAPPVTAPAAAPSTAPPATSPRPVPGAKVSARFGEGVTLASPDGDFSLQLRGRAQLRAAAVVPEGTSSARRVNELVVRRARLALKAKYTDAWQLDVQLAFSNQDMESDAPNVLRDAYVTWHGLRDVNVRAGQTKVPFGKQRVVSSSALQMVDRSIVVGELNLDRDVGVMVRSDDLFGWGGRLAYAVGVMGGDGRNRLGGNAGLLYFARVQVSPFGKFDDLVEGDTARLAKPRLSLGLAAARNNDTVRPRSTIGTPYKNGATTYEHAAADLLFKWRGFSLLSEALYRQAAREQLPGATSTEWARSGWGYVVQAGYLPVDQLEVTARWGQLRPFAGTDPSFHHQRELGAGLGWYPKGHDLKLQADYFWLATGEDFGAGAHQVRVQLQLYF